MSQYFFIGSCFSVEISSRLEKMSLASELHLNQPNTSSVKLLNQPEFHVLANPFGTLFAPTAIAETLEIIAGIQAPRLTPFNQNYHCLTFASKFQSQNEDALRREISNVTEKTLYFLQKTQKAIITLGTAWVYEFIPEKQLVGNCHRIPNPNFSKTLLTTQQVKDSLLRCTNALKALSPEIKIDFTISPVRHLRDGLIENSISKSILRVALHEFLTAHNEFGYFPAFEIFNEELRDKSFFKPDLAHPSDEAIDLIFEKWLNFEGLIG